MWLFGTLFTLPSGTQMLASMGEVSAPVLEDFWPLAVLVGGIGIALIIFTSITDAIWEKKHPPLK